MKSLITVLLFISSYLAAISQTSPVSWSFALESTANASYKVTATATIAEGWSMYSQHTDPDGPVPTQVVFENATSTAQNATEQTTVTKVYSELFELEVQKFTKEAIFFQVVTPVEGAVAVKGYVRYMCCDDTKCLPPTEAHFQLPL